MLNNIWHYFTDWACPYKRAFWSIVAIDGPLATFDFGIVYAWFFAYDEIIHKIGVSAGALAGILACVLTGLRIAVIWKDLHKK